MSTFYCEMCGPVVHQPIPEDEGHCPCDPADVGWCWCACHGWLMVSRERQGGRLTVCFQRVES